MLRSTIFCLGVALLCWGRLSLGFVPTAPSNSVSMQNAKTMLRYSDTVLTERKEALIRKLPPIKRQKLSRLEKEFRELLEAMLFTDEEMTSITNPRMRSIYEGIAASYYVPEVYRAFEVLYEDLAPLRLAGRMIHGKLQNIMDESKEYQQEQLTQVMSNTEFTAEETLKCWTAFIKISGDREISSDCLEKILRQDLHSNFVDDVPSQGNPESPFISDGRENLSFAEFVELCFTLSPDFTATRLQELLEAPTLRTASPESLLDEKHLKYSNRYDDMLVKFGEWKEFIPSGEGRRLDILRGCFVGSENPKVVDALRVVYTDFSALRISGDWIFQLVSTLMNSTMKRRRNRSSHRLMP